MKTFQLNAEPRVALGKKAAKALRLDEKIPCVLNGGKVVELKDGKYAGTLKDGEKLNEKITINEFNTFLNRLIKTSRVYRSSHDIIIGPRSDDGKTRLDYSKSFEGLGLEISRDLEKRSRFIPDKDKSVELLVGEKKNSVKSLNDEVEMKSPEKNVISTKMPQMGM